MHQQSMHQQSVEGLFQAPLPIMNGRVGQFSVGRVGDCYVAYLLGEYQTLATSTRGFIRDQS